MKISDRTHPITKYLHDANLPDVALDKNDTYYRDPKFDMFLRFKHVRKDFRQIHIISKPFYEAFIKASDKLFKIFNYATEDEFLHMTDDFSGTYILGDNIFCFRWQKSTRKDRLDMLGADFFFFQKDKTYCNNLALLGNVRITPNAPLGVYDNSHSKLCWTSTREKPDNVIGYFGSIILLYNFIKYCDTETKILPANQKKIYDKQKYINTTKSDVIIYDSNWFTTLVRSEGFKVSGHFRLQPCGVGYKEKKLIWINDFEKHGYVRKFRKNTLDNLGDAVEEFEERVSNE